MVAISWTITAFSVIGAILNAKGRIEGFYVWIAANTGWIVYNIINDEYALAALFAVYTIICVYGIRHWRKSR